MSSRIPFSGLAIAAIALAAPALAYDASGPSPDDPAAASWVASEVGAGHALASGATSPSPDDPSYLRVAPIARGEAKRAEAKSGEAKMDCPCDASACAHRAAPAEKPMAPRTDLETVPDLGESIG